ncbi:glycosyltransferase family protein [Crateriforma conspicua]|uniref:hypothetical protein n=1 Tax=Crateriforma conspicua TaxID=2527996 RepID=UPI00118CF9D2|nr:hypothetical protein [Crateriforma conspicua]QDV62561.1 hypothetical protein Mal65_16950 [Crateriforma conspicua]
MMESDFPKPTEDLGVMYIAIGGRSLWQLRRSLASLRHHCPNVPVALFTNQPAESCPRVEYRFEVSATGGYHVKPRFIPWLPFERTIYLDVDTVILKPSAIAPADLLTDQFGYEAAYVHGVSRRCDKVRICGVPSMNSGVLMLRKCPRVLRALAHWRRTYRGGNDEILLTKALLRHRVPSYVLPAEWNCRVRGQVRHYSVIRITHHRHVLRLVQPDGSVPEELLRQWWETGIAQPTGALVA